jgi:enoyl-CoA hydratase
MFRRITGPQAVAATVLFGEVLDGAEAERIGLVWRCVDDDALLPTARELAGRAAAAPRELVIRTKATIAAMATIDDHEAALERELEPQLWSVSQPEFRERLAAMQARIKGSN